MARLRITLAFCALSLISGSGDLSAATLEQWKERATEFVAKFEGSDFDAVTLDSDCQGLSLGKEQYAVAVNSTKDLFAAIDRMAGAGGIQKVIETSSASKADDIKAFVTESMSDKPERMSRVRSWQEIRVDGKWKDLEEGECKTNKKRTIDAKNLRLKPGYLQDLKAILKHVASLNAQEDLLARRGKLALERSTCWAKEARQAARPSFQEFLFFFDYLVQNGDTFTVGNTLQTAALRMAFDDKLTAANKDPAVRRKMLQLREWLTADFDHMRNKGRTNDHSDYAKDNAAEWFERYQTGQIDKNQVRLSYIGLLRAILGNNEWAYNAMNRRGTIVFSGGTANGEKYSNAAMSELFAMAGEIDADLTTAIQCP